MQFPQVKKLLQLLKIEHKYIFSQQYTKEVNFVRLQEVRIKFPVDISITKLYTSDHMSLLMEQ